MPFRNMFIVDKCSFIWSDGHMTCVSRRIADPIFIDLANKKRRPCAKSFLHMLNYKIKARLSFPPHSARIAVNLSSLATG